MTAHRESFEQLIVRHRSLAADLVREVLSRVPGHVDRHDLRAAADTALDRSARTYRGEGAFTAHAAREIRLALRDLLRSLPCPTPDPVSAPVDRLAALESAIDALPARLRDVVTDYFLRARPVAAIAGEQGLDVDGVRTLVHDGLELLRDALNAEAARANHASVVRRPRHARVTRRTTSARFEYLARSRGLVGGLAVLH